MEQSQYQNFWLCEEANKPGTLKSALPAGLKAWNGEKSCLKDRLFYPLDHRGLLKHRQFQDKTVEFFQTF